MPKYLHYAMLIVVAVATLLGGGQLLDPLPDIPPGPVNVALTTVASGLVAPNWGVPSPGAFPRRMYVSDQIGVVVLIDVANGAKSVFLDVRSRLVTLNAFYDERGLLGIAFHPEYAVNGLMYTYTSEPDNGAPDFSTLSGAQTPDHHSVITEWRVPLPLDPASVPDPGTARELMRIDQPQSNHNGGALDFGPDGMLYISLGDGGGADDEGDGHGVSGNGRDPGTVLGSILRIDPSGADSLNGQYGVPADNPFFPGGVAPFGGQTGCDTDGFCDEIYAYGLRNPFRVSFDTANGRFFIADVGQNDIEEIDMGASGANYGWNGKEGTFLFDGDGAGTGFVFQDSPGIPPGATDPTGQYDHDDGIAVVGGFAYRGALIPQLIGRYVFGDFSRNFFGNDGRLFVLGGPGNIFEVGIDGQAGLELSLLGFGRDSRGELYVLGNTTGAPSGATGVVRRIDPPPPPPPMTATIVAMPDLTFSPSSVTIAAGGTVTFVNAGGPHNVLGPDFRCANGCDGEGGDGNPSDNAWEFQITFPDPGTVDFLCEPHQFFGMAGQIIVH